MSTLSGYVTREELRELCSRGWNPVKLELPPEPSDRSGYRVATFFVDSDLPAIMSGASWDTEPSPSALSGAQQEALWRSADFEPGTDPGQQWTCVCHGVNEPDVDSCEHCND